MNWYRLAIAVYPEDISAKFMSHIPKESRPNYLAIESGSSQNDSTSVNVVYYSDAKLNEFINDFDFNSIEEALSFCIDILGVDRSQINFLDEPQVIY